MPETLPNRASDAGPESKPRDWYEWTCDAEDILREARRTERGNPARRNLIQGAIDALANALEDLQ